MQTQSRGIVVAETFGSRLRTLRERASLTQEELADRAAMSVNGISALERGARKRPYPHTVRVLADALGLVAADREWLCGAARTAPAQATGSAPPEPARPVPVAMTPIVGRDDDVGRVLDLLAEPAVRLVTLTGPGGVGKTRLSIEVAQHVADRFRDGVAFVPLAPVSDPAALPAAVARGLGLRDLAPGDGEPGDLVAALAGHLRGTELLLVLDNFEHLAAAAPAVPALLACCPGLTVLVSSRAALRVRGEQEYGVPPLALPPSTRRALPEDVVASPAGQLFLARARSVLPSFEVTPSTADDVAAICWRLAGLPLALELAAANVKLLSLEGLLERLDQALSTGWTCDLPERQRGLRTTLDWSHGLLDPLAQNLFRRLSVFAGGFTIEAAEAVAGPELPAAQVLPALSRLVEQSLVVARHDEAGHVRYDLLVPIRQYAGSLLDDAERAQVGDAHMRCYLALVQVAAPGLETDEQVAWLGRLELEDGNIRRAVRHSLAVGEPGVTARMCWSMWLAWWLRGGDLQGREWVEQALLQPLDPDDRARAAVAAACLAYVQHDYDLAARRWAQGEQCARLTGDRHMQANGIAGGGLVSMATGDLVTAEQRLRQALALSQGAGSEWLRSLLLVWIGTTRLVSGDPESAVALVQDGLALARHRGDRLVTYVALFNLAQAATAVGEPDRAAELLREGVRLSQETGDRANTACFLQSLAVVEAMSGGWPLAAFLVGAADGARDSVLGSGYNFYLPDDRPLRQMLVQARAVLGSDFDAAVQRGRSMPLDAAVDEALAGAPRVVDVRLAEAVLQPAAVTAPG
ncbi:MAG TPA: helix-turn-helix domain-containing protein [Actinomycetales bacterium]